MQKHIFMEFSMLRKLLVSGAGVALFLVLSNIRLAEAYHYKSLEYILILSFGYLDIDTIKYVIPVLFWMAPQIFLLYFLGDYISRNLSKNAVYIFTRTDQRKTWLIAKVITLFLYVLFYYTIQILVACFVGSTLGYEILNWKEGISLILGELVLQVLLNYMIILLINVLSLQIDVIFSSVLLLVGNASCLFFSQYINEFFNGMVGIVKWMPFTQGILAWHSDAAAVSDVQGLSSFQIPDFSISLSIVYMGVVSIVCIFWGIRKIKKMDIM